jgi:hypothetical protein
MLVATDSTNGGIMRGAGRASDGTRRAAFVASGGTPDSTFAAVAMPPIAPADDGLGDQGAGDLRLHHGLFGLRPLPLAIIGGILTMALLWPIALADPKPLTLWALAGGASAILALTYSSRVIRAGRPERSPSWAVGRVVWIAVVATLVAVPLLWLLA